MDLLSEIKVVVWDLIYLEHTVPGGSEDDEHSWLSKFHWEIVEPHAFVSLSWVQMPQ